MIVGIIAFLIVHFIKIPVFDVNIFFHLHCDARKTVYLIDEPIEDHLFCGSFKFDKKEVYEFQSTNFVVSNEESIVFKNCDIGILNHKFLKKFPKALSIQLDNVTFMMSQSRPANLPIREISIYGGNVSLQNYRAWNNLTELRTFLLGRTSRVFSKSNTIPNDFFQGNKNLESIKIFKENIEFIQESVFTEMLFLQSVSLTDLKLKSLPIRLFKDNGLLEYVNLSGNLFGRIPGNFYSLRLKHFTLKSCHITNIVSSDLLYKTQLEYLVLDDNRIQTFEKGVFERLKRLRYLSVAGNELRNLTLADFGEMQFLEGINVEWNYLNTTNFLPQDWNNEELTVEYLDQWNREVIKEVGSEGKFSVTGRFVKKV